MQIFPITEVPQRLAVCDSKVNKVCFYVGHVTDNKPGKLVLSYTLRKNNLGIWPPEQLEYLATLRGDFTVQLMPTKEVFYVSAGKNNPLQGNLFSIYGEDNNNHLLNEDVLTLVQKITILERQNDTLQKEVENLQEQVQYFESAGNKFSYSMEQLIGRMFPQIQTFMSTNQAPTRQRAAAPMQGGETFDWQTYKSDQELELKDAFLILAAALSEEKIIEIAEKLQDNPALVQQIKTFL
jgi:cell division protein FtsL